MHSKGLTLPKWRLDLCPHFWEAISKPLECLLQMSMFAYLKALGHGQIILVNNVIYGEGRAFSSMASPQVLEGAGG